MVHFGEETEPPRGSAEGHRLPDAKPFGERGMETEPFRGEPPGTIGDHDVENPGRAEALSAAQHRKDLPADGNGHPCLEIPDGNHLATVFVVLREEVEGVVRRPDPPGGKLFPQAGPHPLDVLDGVLMFRVTHPVMPLQLRLIALNTNPSPLCAVSPSVPSLRRI